MAVHYRYDWYREIITPSPQEKPIKTIVLINPNSNTEATDSMTELAQREVGARAQVEGRSNAAARAAVNAIDQPLSGRPIQ
jgi:hypothetical protein